MNPSANERTGLDLPAPLVPEMTPAAGSSEAGSTAPEAAPLGSETGSANMPPAGAAIPQIPLPTMTPASFGSPQTDVPNTTQTVVPVTADDGDLIEKEWVNKAKQIVERTRDDPYQQTEQLTVVKADYLKRRYNKSVKQSE